MDAEKYFKRGDDCFEYGDDDNKAIALFSRAIELDPTLVIAYLGRGLAYGRKGEFNKTIEDFSKAIEIDPNYVDAYDGLGMAYISLGEYGKAIEKCSRSKELAPNSGGGYFISGLAYCRTGEYHKAIVNFSKTIAIEPKFAEAYNCRGFAYTQNGDDEKAIEDYSMAIKLDPGFAAAYVNLRNAIRARRQGVIGMKVIKVELSIFDKMVGEQLIRMVKSQSDTDHKYSINNIRCGPESVYKALVSVGIPPGNPYLDVFMLVDSSGTIANRLMPVWQPQKKPCGNKLFKSRVSITFDNKLRGLSLDADEVTIVKQQAQSSEFEYFINRIQCRPKDIRELFVCLLNHGDTLVLDIIFDELI